MVRAKFRVSSKEETLYGGESLFTVKMIPVMPDWKLGPDGVALRDERGCLVPEDTENSKFWKASPSGDLTLGVINADVGMQFKLGQEFYIDFTPVK